MSEIDPWDSEPLRVSILAQGPYLIASVHTALDDEHFERFQRRLSDQIGRKRARGVIIDVAALDVVDSFGSRTLRDLGQVARLRGAEIVVVGIQPEVAFAMVKFGINLEPIPTVLDLEEGLALLDQLTGARTGRPPR
jgi:rsbT antagonist protein RsbS